MFGAASAPYSPVAALRPICSAASGSLCIGISISEPKHSRMAVMLLFHEWILVNTINDRDKSGSEWHLAARAVKEDEANARSDH